jgi:single-stranded-DNA-specific exonuclease
MPELSAYPPLLATLLRARGIATDADAEVFLSPDYTRDIGDPFGIIDMEKAVTRILHALTAGERIVIFGDYDCDGIPGSVVLHDLFRKIGYDKAGNYIPHRHLEGYGLNGEAIEKFAKEGVSLIITVDCGITDVAEVEHAGTLGIDVIITDHHLPQAVLPPAYAVVNSKREEDIYSDKMLCGAGVAWKLAVALLERGKEREVPGFSGIPDGWEKWLLDMVGLSTVADMVPLVNENRALAHFGLTVLRKSPRPGLQRLLALAGVDQRRLTEEDIGFTIAPRINAASRMDIPFTAFSMLASTDPAEAGALAERLADLNDERKTEVARMMKEVRAHLAEREIRDVIVIGSPSWRVGIAGLAAGKIAEEFDRPTFVWGKEGSAHIKGSCRSNGKVNMVELMVAVDEGVFIDKGGHEESGGFSISAEKIHLLDDALNVAFTRVTMKERMEGAGEPDATLGLADVSDATYRMIARLAPFGVGNPRPVFRFPSVSLRKVVQFGKGKEHLRLTLTDASGRVVDAIAFFSSPKDYPKASVVEGGMVTLDAVMEESWFRGRRELRLRIVDIT